MTCAPSSRVSSSWVSPSTSMSGSSTWAPSEVAVAAGGAPMVEAAVVEAALVEAALVEAAAVEDVAGEDVAAADAAVVEAAPDSTGCRAARSWSGGVDA